MKIISTTIKWSSSTTNENSHQREPAAVVFGLGEAQPASTGDLSAAFMNRPLAVGSHPES
jgi:hypothetical protein